MIELMITIVITNCSDDNDSMDNNGITDGNIKRIINYHTDNDNSDDSVDNDGNCISYKDYIGVTAADYDNSNNHNENNDDHDNKNDIIDKDQKM